MDTAGDDVVINVVVSAIVITEVTLVDTVVIDTGDCPVVDVIVTDGSPEVMVDIATGDCAEVVVDIATGDCPGDVVIVDISTGDCPGDIIITRTFSAFDDCGNMVTGDQVITVVIERASGPCEPDDCECDGCCPPAAASDCLAVDCQAVSCSSSPCEAIACTCGLLDNSKEIIHQQIEEDLPQCKPVYIYVNDDDDTMKEVDTTQIAKQRMFVTNEPLHESVLQSKTNGASVLSFSFVLFALIALLFI